MLSDDFIRDFHNLFAEDQARFKEPPGWQDRKIEDSPLLTALDDVWEELKQLYESELPELAYREVPDSTSVIASFKELIAVL